MHIWKNLAACTSEAYIASPTSPPYVGKQLAALFHTQSLSVVYSNAAPTVAKLRIIVKAQPSTHSTWPGHQLGLAYGHETNEQQSRPLWPFCCSQTCFHKQALLTTHSYVT